MMQRFLENRWPFGNSRKIESLASQVAKISVEGVHFRIVGCLAAMTTSEARGFIRARAAQEIRRQARILLSHQQNSGSDWETRIVRCATEKVIPLVLRSQHEMPVSQPASKKAA